jgi:hypothetical protein
VDVHHHNGGFAFGAARNNERARDWPSFDGYIYLE